MTTPADLIAHLEYAHPHIALSIKMEWGLPDCDEYISGLLLPARLNRSGFDEPTVQALIALQELHQRLFPQPHDVWEAA